MVLLVQLVLYIVVLALAVPVGFLLANLCKDELLNGKRWFRLIIICLFPWILVSFLFFPLAISLTLAFTLIAFIVLLVKSK
jgi:hypothetical protein